jgi:hypothetical protein
LAVFPTADFAFLAFFAFFAFFAITAPYAETQVSSNGRRVNPC